MTLPEASARRPRGRCTRRWVQTEAGRTARFLLYPSLTSLEEFAGATRCPHTMITVGLGVRIIRLNSRTRYQHTAFKSRLESHEGAVRNEHPARSAYAIVRRALEM